MLDYQGKSTVPLGVQLVPLVGGGQLLLPVVVNYFAAGRSKPYKSKYPLYTVISVYTAKITSSGILIPTQGRGAVQLSLAVQLPRGRWRRKRQKRCFFGACINAVLHAVTVNRDCAGIILGIIGI